MPDIEERLAQLEAAVAALQAMMNPPALPPERAEVPSPAPPPPEPLAPPPELPKFELVPPLPERADMPEPEAGA